jgi:hypothetical protein
MAKGAACDEGDKIERRVLSGWRVGGANAYRVSKLALEIGGTPMLAL